MADNGYKPQQKAVFCLAYDRFEVWRHKPLNVLEGCLSEKHGGRVSQCVNTQSSFQKKD